MSDEEITAKITRLEQQISFLLDRTLEDDVQDGLGDQPIEQPVVVGDSFPWSSVHLSTRMTATATATVQGGSFWVGTNAAKAIATSTRTITADLQYLWLEYDYGANTLTLSSPATSLPTLTATSDLFILPLAKFSYDGTTAAITDYFYLGGDYHLPGTWAR